jgi:NADH:ubiquinone oxidoreductase subunit C
VVPLALFVSSENCGFLGSLLSVYMRSCDLFSGLLQRIIVGDAGFFWFVVTKVRCALLLTILKYHSGLQFKTLIDIAVYDVPGRRLRFILNYLLLSVRYNSRAVVRTALSEISAIVSIVKLYQNANWLEREV